MWGLARAVNVIAPSSSQRTLNEQREASALVPETRLPWEVQEIGSIARRA
jgi:hypothetical protein